ncbi:MAG: VIT1/CCC1 transporter family protein [Candidatus Asgardarchaeia archaeon]
MNSCTKIYSKRWGRKGVEHIRDIFLGMNDSLVEMLATIAGMTGAYGKKPFIIGVIGSIVGLSGMLSMAIGTYISVKNQREVKEQKLFESKIVKEVLEEGVEYEELLEDPLKSAYYTGLFYILGTGLIVFPFFLGIESSYALMISSLAAVVAWIISGSLIALTSGLSAKKKILEMVVTG